MSSTFTASLDLNLLATELFTAGVSRGPIRTNILSNVRMATGTSDGQINKAWYKRWRHEGLYVLAGGVIRRATDTLGQEVTKPVLLKVDGTQETDPDAAYFFHTQVYGSLPYASLGLI